MLLVFIVSFWIINCMFYFKVDALEADHSFVYISYQQQWITYKTIKIWTQVI